MAAEMRLLLVEGEPADIRLVQDYLNQSSRFVFQIQPASTMEAARESLRSGNRFDAVLLDLDLPDSKGLETLEEFSRFCLGLPIVILTGRDDETLALKSVELGAQDYLPKCKLNPVNLERTIVRAVERKRLFAQIEESNRKLLAERQNLIETFEDLINGVLIVSAGGIVLYANASAKALIGERAMAGEDFGLTAGIGEVREETIDSGPAGETTVEIRTVPTRWHDEEVLLVSLHDITRLKAYERQLSRRLRYEAGLAACSRILLGAPHADDALQRALGYLLEMSGASRLSLFRNITKDGEQAAELYIEIGASDAFPGVAASVLNGRPYRKGLERWRDSLGCGEACGGVVMSLPQNERVLFEALDILSLIAVPLFQHGQWEGFLLLEDSVEERLWSEEEVSLLTTGAGIIASYLDLSAAQQELEVERARHELALAGADLGLVDLDLKKDRIHCNRRFLDILGLPEGSGPRTSKEFEDLTHPEDREANRRAFRQHLKDQAGPAEREFRFRRPGGSIVWVLYRGRIVEWDEDGKPLRLTGTVLDITDRKEKEEERRRLVAAVEQTHEALIITDPNGRIVYVNAAFERITGYTAQEALGQKPRELKQGLSNESVEEEILETIRAGKVWTGTLYNKRKDGTVFEEEMAISPVFDETGRIVNHLAVSRDVTHERSLERALRNRQRYESIGTFAGGVAHEINNPMMSIVNYAQLIRDDSSGEVADFATEIIKQGERVSSIVRDLMSFSYPQTGKSKKPESVEKIVNSALSLVRTVLRHAKIELIVETEEDLPYVACQEQRIREVLINLITNAREALSADGATSIKDRELIVRAHRISRRGKTWVRFTVEDHGPGIPKEMHDQLFDPFYTTKDRTKNSGLGLSIAQGIARDHGGSLTVESRPGCTRFHLDIPASPIDS